MTTLQRDGETWGLLTGLWFWSLGRFYIRLEFYGTRYHSGLRFPLIEIGISAHA